jgi:hypothetical protein
MSLSVTVDAGVPTPNTEPAVLGEPKPSANGCD